MSQPDPHLQDRAKKAERIIAEPDKFKICEGCDSIVAARVTVCPNCYGYRFDADREAIIAQARVLATRARTSVIADDLI
jgi:RNA polymerase subunit RPABC4/transcription elongation factor Spt4